MNAYFIDTSFLLAITLSRDTHHKRAIHLFESLSGLYVTTDYVLVEAADGLSSQPLRHLVTPLLDEIAGEPTITVIAASRSLRDEGLRLFSARPDKEWSLTDCISFVVMQDRGLTDALTADHHFEQAGFRALLRS